MLFLAILRRSAVTAINLYPGSPWATAIDPGHCSNLWKDVEPFRFHGTLDYSCPLRGINGHQAINFRVVAGTTAEMHLPPHTAVAVTISVRMLYVRTAQVKEV